MISNQILLQTPVLILLFSKVIIAIFLTIAFINSLKIVKNWNFNSSSPLQYRLENLNYLNSLIIYITLFLQIALLPFLVYVIDYLHDIVPGAMCGAGVISANIYGFPLLWTDILLILLGGYWLILHKEDIKALYYPFTVKKYKFFILIFLIALLDLFLEFGFFLNISLKRVVSCCSVIFAHTQNSPIIFNLNTKSLLIIFYLLTVLSIYYAYYKDRFLLSIASIFWGVFSYYAIVYFFGTYIYELPTHICPFCMLQSNYYYIGYAIWGLYLGVLFLGSANAFLKLFAQKEESVYYTYFIIFIVALVVVLSAYPILYKLRTGLFL